MSKRDWVVVTLDLGTAIAKAFAFTSMLVTAVFIVFILEGYWIDFVEKHTDGSSEAAIGGCGIPIVLILFATLTVRFYAKEKSGGSHD